MNIVQIGACVGNDALTEYVNSQETITNLILVEPMVIHNDKLKESYKDHKFVIENSAITPNSSIQEMSFYYHKEDGPNFEVASVNKEHILKHVIYNPKLTEDGIVELQVPCLTINQLFEKHNLKTIDYLFIDAEGIDDQIILSIDFKKYDIRKIFFEAHHIDIHNLTMFLKYAGYTCEVAGPWGGDRLATKII
jgi:FkbM family methyltransferase